jgi:hypothetical protein
MDSSEITANEQFVFNGIEGRSGQYLFPPMSAAEIVERLRTMPWSSEKALGPGTDPKDLSTTGWGVIFHERASTAVREALAPLLEHRKAQAGREVEHYYKEFSGEHGYHDGQSKEDFLAESGAVTGGVNPDRVPYYLLLVGGPEEIPFHFQHQLDVQYAVGRISFDTPEEYARYAQSVVDAETKGAERARRLALFGVCNPDDYATSLSADRLVRPLAEKLAKPERWQDVRDWEVRASVAEEATKARLGGLLAEEKGPAILFTASHGMGFLHGDPLQRDHQGALLCQDWPGPKQWTEGVPPDLYFSGDDVSGDARIHGLIAFHFACHGVGTPATDEFGMRNGNGSAPRALAPQPFVARLPQRLLAHPAGGALAVVGHVERTWAYSFLGKRSLSQLEAFDWALRLLMDGFPVGYAMEYFNQRYGELSADLTLAIQQIGYGEKFSKEELAGLWTANNDARNYAVLGDPAVRVKVE